MAKRRPTPQLRRVRAAVLAGRTWRDAARAGGLSFGGAYKGAIRWWPDLKGRRPRLDDAKRQAIQRAIMQAEGESYRELAAAHHCSPDTISRLARQMAEAQTSDIGPPIRGQRPSRCSGCGNQVTLKPCQICEARRYGNQTRARHIQNDRD